MSEFTVFLVDDDSAVLTALSRLLRAAGYATKTYCSAEAFLSEHDASTPGCAVLDLSMPGLNLDVQEALVHQGVELPVIFLTGHGTIRETVLAMRAGAIDFLTKPVGNSELMSAIKSAEDRDRTQRHIGTQRKIVLQKMAKLTHREKDVLALMVLGQQNKAMGYKLGINNQSISRPRPPENGSKKRCRTRADDNRDVFLKQANKTLDLGPLLALSGHSKIGVQCPLLGVKRT